MQSYHRQLARGLSRSTRDRAFPHLIMLSSLVLSTSHVQRTRRKGRNGLGQSRGATLQNERSPAACSLYAPRRVRLAISHARAAATFASSRALASPTRRHARSAFVARLSARTTFPSSVREETFDATARSTLLVGPQCGTSSMRDRAVLL